MHCYLGISRNKWHATFCSLSFIMCFQHHFSYLKVVKPLYFLGLSCLEGIYLFNWNLHQHTVRATYRPSFSPHNISQKTKYVVVVLIGDGPKNGTRSFSEKYAFGCITIIILFIMDKIQKSANLIFQNFVRIQNMSNLKISDNHTRLEKWEKCCVIMIFDS